MFIFGCAGSLLPLGLSSSCGEGGSSLVWGADFSLRWRLLLQSAGFKHVGSSRCSTWLSRCGSRALSSGSVVVAHGFSFSEAREVFPGQGSEPMSPALAGGFLSPVPPGKSEPFHSFFSYQVFKIQCMFDTHTSTS